eukprot:355908-Chlamydomonas_euryale.AAC.9
MVRAFFGNGLYAPLWAWGREGGTRNRSDRHAADGFRRRRPGPCLPEADTRILGGAWIVCWDLLPIGVMREQNDRSPPRPAPTRRWVDPYDGRSPEEPYKREKRYSLTEVTSSQSPLACPNRAESKHKWIYPHGVM